VQVVFLSTTKENDPTTQNYFTYTIYRVDNFDTNIA